MGRKVFISVLGKSIYGKCVYKCDNFKSSNTRFIQCATLEMLTQKENWDNEAKGIILVTDEAFKENWITTQGKVDRSNEEYIGLNDEILKLNLPFSVTHQPIPEGTNEKEIEVIFESVVKLLEEYDDCDLYIDITHGFRYLPMLVVVLTNYLKYLKNITCKSFSYGNYETRVKVNDIEEAPIIDLNSLSMIQDWTAAIDHMTTSGNTAKMKELCVSVVKESKGTNMSYRALRSLVGPLETLTKDLKTCQGRQLIKAGNVKNLKSRIRENSSEDLPKIFQPILSKIEADFSNFSENQDWKNGLHAAIWCYNHQQYQQAITLLRESIISGICSELNLDWALEDIRNCISNVLANIGQLNVEYQMHNDRTVDRSSFLIEKIDLSPEEKVNSDEKVAFSQEGKKYAKQIVLNPSLFRLAIIFYNSRDPRNVYNHAGMLKDKEMLRSDNIINQIESRIRDIEEWLNFSPTEDTKTNQVRIFVNFTNHPSKQWERKQIEYALHNSSQIIDEPFPEISSLADKGDVSDLVNQYVEHFTELYDCTTSTVHIMGEMTFTYAMVNALKALGYTCVASTTKRIVEELEDGTKNVKFEFCQFREY